MKRRAPLTEPWKNEAICAQTDPSLFFPEAGDDGREAKAVCYRCPVRRACLVYALKNDENHGVWGGMTVRERRALRRQATQQAAA